MKDSSYSYRQLLLLSVPAVLAGVVEPLAGLVDTAFVGHLSSEWLASMALSTAVFSAVTWIFNFLVVTVNARIAQSKGKRNPEEIGKDLQLAILASFLCGLIAMVIVLGGSEFILRHLMGASEPLVQTALPYFYLRSLAIPLTLFISTLTGTLRGTQRLTTAFLLVLVITVLNAVFNYIFLYIYKMNFEGAALGTLLAFAIGAALGIGLLIRQRQELGLSRLYPIELKRALNFGAESINVFLRTASITASFFIATSLATRLGTTTLAAYQALFQFWIFPAFVLDAFGILGTTFGGFYLGRGELQNFFLVCKKLLNLGALIGIFIMIAYLIGEPWLKSAFTDSTEVLDSMKSSWWVIALAQVPGALVYVFDGILFGAKEFAFLRKRMIEAFLLVFLPINILNYFYFQELWMIWLSLTGLLLYRLTSSVFCFFNKLKNQGPS